MFCFMVFNATFNNISVISWQSVLLVKETGVPRENHRYVASHWQILSNKCCIEYTSTWAGFKHTTLVVIDTDYIGSCKSNYNTITAATAHGVGFFFLKVKNASLHITLSKTHSGCIRTRNIHLPEPKTKVK